MPEAIRHRGEVVPKTGCQMDEINPETGKLEHPDHSQDAPLKDPKTSGATKEAAASKSAEHQIAGQSRQAKLRAWQSPTVMVNGQPVAPSKANDHEHKEPSIYEQSGTVQIDGKSPYRKDDKSDCTTPQDSKKENL